MEQSLLSQSVWLSLPLETRAKLAKLFELPEKGSVQTMYGPNGPEVITDGYGYNHLKLISLEKMQAMLSSDSMNFYDLFRAVVANLDDLLDPKTLVEEITITKTIIEAPKKRGRKPKNHEA